MRRIIIIFAHAMLTWALCGLTMGLGLFLTTLNMALLIHAVAAPVIAALVAWHYFKRYAFTSPLLTAAIFAGFALFMDVVIVAMLINKSFAMFASFVGTWLPLGLMFVAVWLVGVLVLRRAN